MPGSADWKDRLGGDPTAVATAVLVGTAPQLLRPALDGRIAVNVQPDANGFVGIATGFNATVAALAYVPSGAVFEERDYRGPLYGKTEGATAAFRVYEV